MQRSIVAFAAAALMLGLAPQAYAGARAAAPAAPTGPTKAQLDRGAKEAPAIAQQARVTCTISAASWLGQADQKDPAGKAYKAQLYELACNEGLGYVLQTRSAAEGPLAFDCIAAKGSPVACTLPANTAPEKGLQPIAQQTGIACNVNNARYIGTNAQAGTSFYEVACAEGLGYVLTAASPGSTAKPSAMSCIKAEAAKTECQFTPKEARMAHIAKLAAPAPDAKDCTIAQSRWVAGDPAKNTEWYEIGCSGGKSGFMVEVSSTEQFQRSLACALATGIAGGCTFTDVNTAQTSEAGTYTRLANAAGMACTVSEYRALGIDSTTKDEIVELGCSNRPGMVAFFPSSSTGKARFYDCIRAATRGMNCRLTTIDKVYPTLTQALATAGKTTCTVSGARAIGIATDTNSEFIETACSDGLPGWVLEFDASSERVKQVLACAQARGIGGGCNLPGNASAAPAAGGTRR